MTIPIAPLADRRSSKSSFAACVLVFGAVPQIFAQQTIELAPARDNSIYAENSNASNGAGDLFTGFNSRNDERRALIWFDFSSLAGLTVLTAELEVTVEQTNTVDGQFDLYALNNDWGEAASMGSGSGGAAQMDDATWSQRFFPDVDWMSPGGDFDPMPLTTTTIGDAPNSFVFPSSLLLVAQIQSWIDQPAENFGLIIIGDDAGAKRLQSREAPIGGPLLRLSVDMGVIFADGFEG